jgi:hypothetical protein
MVRLRFNNQTNFEIQNMPSPGASNYIYVQGGAIHFGDFDMVAPRIQLVDKKPANPFRFSLKGYWSLLPASDIKFTTDQSVLVTMPDQPR